MPYKEKRGVSRCEFEGSDEDVVVSFKSAYLLAYSYTVGQTALRIWPMGKTRRQSSQLLVLFEIYFSN